MSLIVQWEGGDGITTVSSGSYVGFYGETFNSSIPLNNYNSLTKVTNITGTLDNGDLPNIKYTSPGYAIWNNPTNGLNSGSITGVSFDDSTLHVRITSGSAVRLSSVNLVVFANNDLSTAPTDATVVAFEQGSTGWTAVGGLASPLALTPHITSGSVIHDYYIGVSVSPTSTSATTQVSFAIVADWY